MNDFWKRRRTGIAKTVPVFVVEFPKIQFISHQSESAGFTNIDKSVYDLIDVLRRNILGLAVMLMTIFCIGCRDFQNQLRYDSGPEQDSPIVAETDSEVHPCENCRFGKCDRRRCAPHLLSSDPLCNKLENWNECSDCDPQKGLLEKIVGRKRVGHCFPLLWRFGIGRRCEPSEYSQPWTPQDDLRVIREARLFFSLDGSRVVDNLRLRNEDIVAFDGEHFARFLDGSDVGLGNLTIDAFTLIGPMEILISFSRPFTVGEKYDLPGLEGEIDDSDIVLFHATQLGEITRGRFELYFDGSDVGLVNDGEDIDALASTKNGTIIISTVGDIHVQNLSGKDEDLFEFVPRTTGENTSGTWKRFLDGSKIGLASKSSEDIDAVSLGVQRNLFLSTRGQFDVKTIAGTGSDVIQLMPSKTGSLNKTAFLKQLYFEGKRLLPDNTNISGISLPLVDRGISQQNTQR